MAKPIIEILKTFEHIPFGAKKEDVRNILQDPYVNSIESLPSKEEVDPVMTIVEEKIKELYKLIGRDSNSFEWPDLTQYQSDYDTYEYFEMEYDKNNELISGSVLAEKCDGMIVNGRVFEGFKIKELLTLADDFEWSSIDTGYISYSKQISIYCPERKNKVDSILFGSPGYYTKDEEK